MQPGYTFAKFSISLVLVLLQQFSSASATSFLTPKLNCDDGLTGPIRLTHNRLLFTVPIEVSGQRATEYIRFCSDDKIEEVAGAFYEKYKSHLNATEIFQKVVSLLVKRKLQYDQNRLEMIKWTAWDKEKSAEKKTRNKNCDLSLSIPHTLHFIWLGSAPVPQYAKENMAVWAKIHPTFDVKLWKDIDVKNIHSQPIWT